MMRLLTAVLIALLLLMVCGEYNITTYVGIGSGDGLPATSAALTYPHGITLDSSENLYIVDTIAEKVRKIGSATNLMSTVAGCGIEDYTGDAGVATSAALNVQFGGIGLDSSNNIYIADRNNNVIRKVTVSTGIITTVAGKGSTVGSVIDNTAATSSKLYYPSDVTLGTLYLQIPRIILYTSY